jgi:hypothetical protein
MRCTPLAVWCSNITDDKLMYKIIETDVTFTHPNKLVIDCVFLYCKSIQYLLNNPE